MSRGYAAALDHASMALTVAFIAEAAAKLLGLGFYGYTSDSFNILDAAFVSMGLLELILAVCAAAGGDLQGLAARCR